MCAIPNEQFLGRKVKKPKGRFTKTSTSSSLSFLFSLAFLNSFQNINCRSTSISTQAVIKSCQGRNTCIVLADSSFLGEDPCPSTPKYLHVRTHNLPVKQSKGHFVCFVILNKQVQVVCSYIDDLFNNRSYIFCNVKVNTQKTDFL